MANNMGNNLKRWFKNKFCEEDHSICIKREENLTHVIEQIIEDFNNQTKQFEIDKDEFHKDIENLKKEVDFLKNELFKINQHTSE